MSDPLSQTVTEQQPLTITTVAERPELADELDEVRDAWPEFMGHDRLANAFFFRVQEVFPEFCVVATAPDGTIVARGR
ncbi:MAG TPA: hypothetical protein VI076_13240 [Actinopolymorphaceae bacterium]